MLVLISTNNNLIIIDEIKTFLDEKIIWFKLNNFQFFKSFYHIEPFIKEVNHELDYDIVEKYSINDVLNFKAKPDKVEELLLYFLITNKESSSGYENEIDFEKVKLLFVLNLFFESLLEIERRINTILTSISKYGVINFEPYLKSNNGIAIKKCNVNLDKISTAFLFKFMMEENIFYMDNIEHKSHSKVKKFAENNFNYTSIKEKSALPLTDFSKEVSKLKGANNKAKQLEVIDMLFKKLEAKKAYLEK
jgi:hypothetical protein